MEITASIIVLNYNGRHYLERCLESLRRQTFQGFELILVDNAVEYFHMGVTLP